MDHRPPTRMALRKIRDLMLEKIAQASGLIATKCGRSPKMIIFAIDPQSASRVYIKNKMDRAKECGIISELVVFDFSDPSDEIIAQMQQRTTHPNVDGAILQLPVPTRFDKLQLINTIPHQKDIDGLTYIQQGRVALGSNLPDVQTPPTASAVLYLAKYIVGSLVSKRILMIGSSNIVGLPFFMLATKSGATVTVANSKTKNLADLCLNADVIVSAVGKAGLIQSNMLHSNSVVIDVGINRDEDHHDGTTRVVGDVDFENCFSITPYITPVPGGVGLFTIVMLLRNLLIGHIAINCPLDPDLMNLINDPIFDPIVAQNINL